MISCSNWRLYVILDRAAAGDRDLAELASAAIRGGADALQLRDKSASPSQVLEEAKRLLSITKPAGIPLIINDHLDVAAEAGADGVHLGQDDLPIAQARAFLGPDRLIGRSTHSLEQAIAAQQEGADYIALGPLFPTPTKPNYPSVGLSLIATVTPHIRVPIVCIGGIDTDNISKVIAAGASCVAVVRAICAALDPELAATTLKVALEQSGRATEPSSL